MLHMCPHAKLRFEVTTQTFPLHRKHVITARQTCLKEISLLNTRICSVLQSSSLPQQTLIPFLFKTTGVLKLYVQFLILFCDNAVVGFRHKNTLWWGKKGDDHVLGYLLLSTRAAGNSPDVSLKNTLGSWLQIVPLSRQHYTFLLSQTKLENVPTLEISSGFHAGRRSVHHRVPSSWRDVCYVAKVSQSVVCRDNADILISHLLVWREAVVTG